MERRTPYDAAPGVLVRLGATVVAAASVLTGRALIRLGLRRRPEGWRRTVGVLLRGEATRFALSAFGLDVPATRSTDGASAEERIARGLVTFLADEPDAHFALEWLPPVTCRRRLPFVDVACLQFASDGTLQDVSLFAAPGAEPPPPPATRDPVHRVVVDAYNRTARFPERRRAGALWEDVRRQLAGRAAEYAHRLLASFCLSFEAVDLAIPERRFAPPAFEARRSLGFGYLSCVARPGADDTVDIWVCAHHVGLDGVPLQDMMTRLERAWGTARPVAFPAPADDGTAFVGPRACHAPDERAIDSLVTFVDLDPLIELRRELNARHARAIGSDLTLGALIAWLLSQEPEFEGVRIASTVDVAASDGYERDVDVVSLRPADFFRGAPPWGGLVEYAREFNRLIVAARARSSPVRRGMQEAGLLPAWAHAAVVRANPASLDDTFGTLCVTIVKDARVFIAPMTDLGLGDGFFAIGSAQLPTSNGRRVTCVSIKGDAGRVGHYPEILQRVLRRAAALANDAPGL